MINYFFTIRSASESSIRLANAEMPEVSVALFRRVETMHGPY
jgi:hypothetical protein